jgi:hypothetical protein
MAKPDNSETQTFVFRKHDTIGSAAAEEDMQFLDDCFVDTGELTFLRDCSSPKRIIVGRTGTGKSALIYRLAQTSPHIVQLSPHSLSLNFIATNKVIAFFEEAGVNLAPFYVLLWRHLLVVELLKKKFNIVNEGSYREVMQRIKAALYRDKYKEQAMDYLEQWGKKFWLTTEERVRELTERVETSLKGNLGGAFSGVSLSTAGAKSLSREQREQIVEHGLDAVSKVQIRELDNLMQVLEEHVFNDRLDHYYVSIDMLDEDWADDRIRFKLIRALIDAVRRFKAIPNVKIILALRQDLLDRVLGFESVSGFQEEKYRALYLNLSWTKENLHEVAERRINKLIRRHYTKQDVTFEDIFPSTVDSRDTFQYLLDRTFYRPRDLIVFLNECLALSEGRPNISAAIIKQAEEGYSVERLQSLANEWSTMWPNLWYSAQLFHGLKEHFELSSVTEEFLQERSIDILPEVKNVDSDPITKALNSLCSSSNGNFATTRNFVMREFYVTGLIGIKTGPTDSIGWARQTSHARLSAGALRPSSTIYIHPMFHRALGVKYIH